MRQYIVQCLLLFTIFSGAAHAGDGTCQLVQSEVCTDGPATKVIGGLNVTRPCWNYESIYQCLGQTYVDDCADLIAKGCNPISSECMLWAGNTQTLCQQYDVSYQCPVGGNQPITKLDCSGQQFCVGGSCFDTSFPADGDFAKTASYIELLRQAAHYMDPNSLTVFNGYDNRCKVKFFGLTNCCKKGSGGAMDWTNSYVSQLGGSLANAATSTYVYDALFASEAPSFVLDAFSSIWSSGASSGLAAFAAGDIAFEQFAELLVPGWGTVIVLAIQFSGILECDEKSKETAMKREARLCHSVGSYCSGQLNLIFTKVCYEKKETYCCYNSRLARIVNEQGRGQIAKGWGTPEGPSCSGYSITDLQKLDFSLMDLSEFYQEIKAKAPNIAGMQGKAAASTNTLTLPAGGVAKPIQSGGAGGGGYYAQ